MYVGRIVAVGRATSGALAALYRVSSRSFPNREAKVMAGAVAVVPKPGFENDIHKNPYIAYNCLRLTGPYAVVSNGSHTDPITEKLAAGMNMRDALITVLGAMDYEHDSLDTPRIAGIVQSGSDRGYLGIIRRDALLVQEFTLAAGKAFYVCTYERNAPAPAYCDQSLVADSATAACRHILAGGAFAELERPVTAAAALWNQAAGKFETAVLDAANS